MCIKWACVLVECNQKNINIMQIKLRAHLMHIKVILYIYICHVRYIYHKTNSGKMFYEILIIRHRFHH